VPRGQDDESMSADSSEDQFVENFRVKLEEQATEETKLIPNFSQTWITKIKSFFTAE
jgi:hypothetical protein